MKRLAAIVVVLLLAPSASAALLIEIKNESVFVAGEVVASFGSGRPHTIGGLGASVSVYSTAPLTPRTATADPEMLARFQQYFADGNREFLVGMNGASGYYPIDDLWHSGTITAIYPNGIVAHVTPHATQRGSGLSGYRLTEVTTQTMPSSQGGQPFAMQQRTFIYGEVVAVPEPASLVLMVMGLLLTQTRKRG